MLLCTCVHVTYAILVFMTHTLYLCSCHIRYTCVHDTYAILVFVIRTVHVHCPYYIFVLDKVLSEKLLHEMHVCV